MFMNNFISHLTFARCSPIHPVTHWSIRLPIHSFIHSLTHVAVSHEMSLPIDSSQLTRCPVTREQLLEMLFPPSVASASGRGIREYIEYIWLCLCWMQRNVQVGGAGRCRAKQRMIIAIAVEIQIEIEIGIRIQIKKKRAHAAYK